MSARGKTLSELDDIPAVAAQWLHIPLEVLQGLASARMEMRECPVGAYISSWTVGRIARAALIASPVEVHAGCHAVQSVALQIMEDAAQAAVLHSWRSPFHA